MYPRRLQQQMAKLFRVKWPERKPSPEEMDGASGGKQIKEEDAHWPDNQERNHDRQCADASPNQMAHKHQRQWDRKPYIEHQRNGSQPWPLDEQLAQHKA